MNRSLSFALWTLIALHGCAEDDLDTPQVEFSSPQDATAMDDRALPDAALSEPAGELFLESLVDRRPLPIRGSTAILNFDAPDDVLSLTIIVQGDPNGWYGIESWTDGDGTDLTSPDWQQNAENDRGCLTCRNFTGLLTQGVSTTVAPNRDTGTVHPGPHRLALSGWVDGFAADQVIVTVIAKRGPEMPDTGTLDLNFYFTGAQGWTAESVQTDRYFAACVQRVNELYGQMGVTIGDMNYFDLDPALSTVSIAENDDTLGALMANSIAGQTEGLNIFFVDRILTGEADYPEIPGVSASVPNPPYLPGTVASGVAVATRGPLEVPPGQRFLDPPAIGQTMAHELGHALGFFHTSEYDEVSHDHYADTPENDNSYLMHADGTGAIISPEQGRALLANPAIRHAD